jgi:hypothetical protein
MFVVTGIVAACLAAGYYFPTAVLVVVSLGLMQVGIVVAGDWLIRPANRRRLALVISAAWLLLGCMSAFIGCFVLLRSIRAGADDSVWAASFSFLAAAIYFHYVAYSRWRKMKNSASAGRTARRRPNHS